MGNAGTYTYINRYGNIVTKEWTITNEEFLDSNALSQAQITEICKKNNPGLNNNNSAISGEIEVKTYSCKYNIWNDEK